MVLSKENMKYLRTIGALATGVALSITAAWYAPVAHGQRTKFFQPTPAQMQSIRKTLAGNKPETKPEKKPAAKPKVLLPAKFGGWVRGSMHSAEPAAANAAAMKEFGWKRGAQAEYSRGGDTLAVRVQQFPDATGAYGAFTMLRASGMKAVRVGPRGRDDARPRRARNVGSGPAPRLTRATRPPRADGRPRSSPVHSPGEVSSVALRGAPCGADGGASRQVPTTRSPRKTPS